MSSQPDIKDIFGRMREFKQFAGKSDKVLHKSLTNRIKILISVYTDEDMILLWHPMDKFALHVISVTEGFSEDMFKRALSDLQRSELEYDSITDSTTKKTYVVLDRYLFSFFNVSKRRDFFDVIDAFVQSNLRTELVLRAMQKIKKPESLQSTKLLDAIVLSVWNKLSHSNDTEWVTKRLRRTKTLEQRIQSYDQDLHDSSSDRENKNNDY